MWWSSRCFLRVPENPYEIRRGQRSERARPDSQALMRTFTGEEGEGITTLAELLSAAMAAARACERRKENREEGRKGGRKGHWRVGPACKREREERRKGG